MKVDVGTFAAEFPNDNPSLHGGALWVCRDVVGPAVVEIVERAGGSAVTALGIMPAAIIAGRGPAPEIRPQYEDAELAISETAAAIARAADILSRALHVDEVVAEAPPTPIVEEDTATEEENMAINALVAEAVHAAIAEVKAAAEAAASAQRAAEAEAQAAAEAEALAAIEAMVVANAKAEAAAAKAEADAEAAAKAEAEAAAKAEAEAAAKAEADAAAEAEAQAEADARPARPSGIMLVGERAAFEDEAHDELVVEELEPLAAEAEIEIVAAAIAADDAPAPMTTSAFEAATILPPASDDPFQLFVAALESLAIAEGSPWAASVVGPLLGQGIAPAGGGAATQAALAAGGILEGDAPTDGFLAVARAWRDILRGTSEDWSACGAMMLDEWAADVLARLMGAPDRVSSLRRDLRTRGVAAFGLVEAA